MPCPAQDAGEYTGIYTKAFLEDCATLRLERPERLVPATEHIDDMVGAIERLGAGNHTYTSDGSVYFRISTFPEYGKLSHNDSAATWRARASTWTNTKRPTPATSRCGKRPRKASRSGPPPSAPPPRLAHRVLRDGHQVPRRDARYSRRRRRSDLPHHENEIAQSESLTGKPFARFWLHAEFLMVEGQKMSKSLGNYYTLRDLLGRGYQPEAIRYLLASAPYRKALNFTFDGLKSSAIAIERLRNFKLRLETDQYAEGVDEALMARTAQASQAFTDSLNDDLNTAEAWPPSSNTCATPTAPWIPASSARATPPRRSSSWPLRFHIRRAQPHGRQR